MKKALFLAACLLAMAARGTAQDTLRTFTFDATDWAQITTGTINLGDFIDGATVDYGHSQTGTASRWQRIPDTNYVVSDNFYNTYPNSVSFIRTNVGYLGADDGFAFMSMLETTSNDEPFNAWFQLPAIDLADSVQVVEVHLTQLYVCFNLDRNYIDYKANGQWKSREINVRGIDCSVNSWGALYPSYTMPLEAAQGASLELRVRWASDDNVGGAYGYFWAVDNLAIVSAQATNWEVTGTEMYVDGAYGTMPQGWEIPLTWYANVRNIGANDIDGITASIYSAPLGQDAATVVATATMESLPAGDVNALYPMVIDGRDIFYDEAPWFFYAYVTAGDATNSGLNTAAEGWYSARAVIEDSDSSLMKEHAFSQRTYRVNAPAEDGTMLWGYGLGILSSADEGYKYGMSYNGYVTGDPEESAWNQDGYGLMVRLTTPNTVPMDTAGEPWVLRGIDMITAPNSNAVGTMLNPIVYKVDAEGIMNVVDVSTAAHVVTADEVNLGLESGYMTEGYNTVRINFVQPVTLEPATTYFIGYQNENDGDFAVAMDARYYLDDDGEQVAFASDSALGAYGRFFTMNPGDIYNFNPNGGNGGGWLGYSISDVPQIRAVVGPMPEIEYHTVTVSHNGGEVYRGSEFIAVGNSVATQVADGATVSYHFVSYSSSESAPVDSLYQLVRLYLDGVQIALDDNQYYDDYSLTFFDDDSYRLYTLTLHEVSVDHSIQAVFGSATIQSATLTVTKNGAGYMGWEYADEEDNGMWVDEGTAVFDVESGREVLFFMYSFTPEAISAFDLTSMIEDGMLSYDALTLTSLYVDGVQVDISSSHSGAGYNLEVNYSLASYGAIGYRLTVSGSHSVTANFGTATDDNCYAVTNLYVDDIDSTSATLHWTANNNGIGAYVVYLYGNAMPDTVYSTSTSVSYPLWGLATGQVYNISVEAICANGETAMSESVSFVPAANQDVTITVTKNGAGYMGWEYADEEDDGTWVDEGTAVFDVESGREVLFFMYSFSQEAISSLGLSDFINMGMLSYDALTLTSLYVDGVQVDISSSNSGAGYNLEVDYSMASYGAIGYMLTVSGSHSVTANFGDGSVEMYPVTFSANDNTLGEVISDGDGDYVGGSSVTSWAIVQGGVTFVGWAVGSQSNIVSTQNPLDITVDSAMNIIAVFTTASLMHDTIYLHDTLYVGGTDTVYIHDTIVVGVDDVMLSNVKLYSQNGQIVVEGAESNEAVLFDAVGRKLEARRDDFGTIRFDVPASGTYLVRVGSSPARRIVVIR